MSMEYHDVWHNINLLCIKICPGRRALWVTYENINNSDLDGVLHASFLPELGQYGLLFDAVLPENYDPMTSHRRKIDAT